jgi:hypothetical protein
MIRLFKRFLLLALLAGLIVLSFAFFKDRDIAKNNSTPDQTVPTEEGSLRALELEYIRYAVSSARIPLFLIG